MKRIALSIIAAGALISGYADQASATPPNAGCPDSYQVWQVGSTPPYQADARVDKNGDGTVCAKQVDDKTFVYDGSSYPSLDGQSFPLYNFIDNTVGPNNG